MLNPLFFPDWVFRNRTALLKQRGEKRNELPSRFRCACIDARHAQKASRKWTLEMDVALVQYINRLCRHLAITPARLHPHEVYLDPADAADPRISCLLSMYWLLAEAFPQWSWVVLLSSWLLPSLGGGQSEALWAKGSAESGSPLYSGVRGPWGALAALLAMC